MTSLCGCIGNKPSRYSALVIPIPYFMNTRQRGTASIFLGARHHADTSDSARCWCRRASHRRPSILNLCAGLPVVIPAYPFLAGGTMINLHHRYSQRFCMISSCESFCRCRPMRTKRSPGCTDYSFRTWIAWRINQCDCQRYPTCGYQHPWRHIGNKPHCDWNE